MHSAIAQNLKPGFEPVAVVWSDELDNDALQYKKGKFGCVLHLFAEASRRGRTAGGSRESILCPGGRAALGLGVEFDESEESLGRYSAMFSKGLESAENPEAYRKYMEASPKSWQDLFTYGERMFCNADLAKEWIEQGLPRYEAPTEYVWFKPLSKADPAESIQAIIFPVNPYELAVLVTLAGSVMPGTDPLQAPQGADCNSITAFPIAQAAKSQPRAVLGMLGADGQAVMHKRFGKDILTVTLPAPLFMRMEQEADDCILQIPSWKNLAK